MNEPNAKEVYGQILAIPFCGASAAELERLHEDILMLPVDVILSDYTVVIAGVEWLVEIPKDEAARDRIEKQLEEDLSLQFGPDVDIGEMIEPGIWRAYVGPQRCVIRAWMVYFGWVELIYWVVRKSEWDGDVPDVLVVASYEAEAHPAEVES